MTTADYPTINELLDRDLQVLHDIEVDDCPCCSGSGERKICVTVMTCEVCGGTGYNGRTVRTLFCIGWKSDLAAGLRGGTIVPWCKSMDELEAHCAANREHLLKDLAS